jgi:hypothetical protein
VKKYIAIGIAGCRRFFLLLFLLILSSELKLFAASYEESSILIHFNLPGKNNSCHSKIYRILNIFQYCRIWRSTEKDPVYWSPFFFQDEVPAGLFSDGGTG